MALLDIIGDLHGCPVELRMLLEELGYTSGPGAMWSHPEGRRVAFLGDLIDRGPDSVGALQLVEELVECGAGFIAAVGNHDYEIYHGLILGKPTKVYYGLQITLDQVEELGIEVEFAEQLQRLFSGAPAFTSLPEEKLVLVHAALRPEMLEAEYAPDWEDANSQMALYGELIQVEGEPFPRKGYQWVDSWPRDWTVVYGHDVISELPIVRGRHQNVIGIETGVSYGGRLTALRWPEMEIVSISAYQVYPEHADDFPKEGPGSVHRFTWPEVLELDHTNTTTIHYLHGKRKTAEMSVPRDIKIDPPEIKVGLSL